MADLAVQVRMSRLMLKSGNRRRWHEGVGLFIYLNISAFLSKNEEKAIVDVMGDAVQPAKDAFRCVWVSWRGVLYDLS